MIGAQSTPALQTEQRKATLQNYDSYTEQDHAVWSILYKRQTELLQRYADVAFLQGMDKIGFTPTAIPDFRILNQKLGELTGWEITAVPGIVDDKLFFEMLAAKQFPCTTWIRTMAQLDYLEEPDMFHDVYGHIPLLSDSSYGDFLVGLSNIALKHIDNPHAIHLLSRIYWYTIEFGLISIQDELKVYGAGILSSQGETPYSVSKEVPKHTFDVKQIFDTVYIKEKFQERYFVIDSYKQLYESLGEIETELDKLLG
jgi:phenylalanine-4-hydroxylase